MEVPFMNKTHAILVTRLCLKKKKEKRRVWQWEWTHATAMSMCGKMLQQQKVGSHTTSISMATCSLSALTSCSLSAYVYKACQEKSILHKTNMGIKCYKRSWTWVEWHRLTSICFCFLLCSSISSFVVLLSLSCSPWSSVSMFLNALSAPPS